MSTDEFDRTVTSPLGIVGMVGGALHPAVLLGVVLVAPGTGSFATTYTSNAFQALPGVFWLAGTAGLYLRHPGTFGWPGRVGTVSFAAGVVGVLGDAFWHVALGSHLYAGRSALAVFGLLLFGALLLGAAVVRARALPHAVAGGLLLALGLPLSTGTLLLLGTVLAVDVPPVVLVVLYTVPFGLGWLVLGYDLLVVPDVRRADG